MKTKLINLIALALACTAALALGLAAAAYAGDHPGGGHTPVTICHKPGTPAEMTLVVDDDAVPGHLGHGDYLGPCQGETTPTDTTPTDTTPTTPTETTPTTPTETTPTTPAVPRCPAGEGPYDGKDGDEAEPGHNDECCPDSNNNQICDYKEQPPTQALTRKDPVTTTETTPTTTTAPPTTSQPAVKPAAKPKPTPVTKTTAAPKLTGNPKKDNCQAKPGGVLECQPGGPGTPKVTVVAGQG